jgi:hypothetical protein
MDLPVYHLDRHFWSHEWTMPLKEDWIAWVDEVIAKPSWILDGNYASSISRRAARADTIVFIDIHWTLALYQYFVRSIRRTRLGQNDIPSSASEGIRWRNIRAILRFSRDIRPVIEQTIAAVPNAFVFRSTEEAMAWVCKVTMCDT